MRSEDYFQKTIQPSWSQAGLFPSIKVKNELRCLDPIPVGAWRVSALWPLEYHPDGLYITGVTAIENSFCGGKNVYELHGTHIYVCLNSSVFIAKEEYLKMSMEQRDAFFNQSSHVLKPGG